MVRNKLKDELEDRADLYVIEKGYKDGLIQALDYYLEIYKPEYDQDINMGYYNLKKRFEDIKSTKA